MSKLVDFRRKPGFGVGIGRFWSWVSDRCFGFQDHLLRVIVDACPRCDSSLTRTCTAGPKASCKISGKDNWGPANAAAHFAVFNDVVANRFEAAFVLEDDGDIRCVC